jgi:hypothetical protein
MLMCMPTRMSKGPRPGRPDLRRANSPVSQPAPWLSGLPHRAAVPEDAGSNPGAGFCARADRRRPNLDMLSVGHACRSEVQLKFSENFSRKCSSAPCQPNIFKHSQPNCMSAPHARREPVVPRFSESLCPEVLRQSRPGQFQPDSHGEFHAEGFGKR